MAVYLVTNKSGEQRVVESANSKEALRYVVKTDYTVKNLNVTELLKFIQAGIEVEKAIPELEAEAELVLEAKEE